jgi:hypothetical protein
MEVICPKCKSVDRCSDCGAPKITRCLGRMYFFRFRGPNVKCSCGHSWRATGDQLNIVDILLDNHQKLFKAKYGLK